MIRQQNTRLGIWLMLASCFVFAAQDGLSRHLGEVTNVYFVVMIRFWFFGLFVVVLAARAPGGLRVVLRPARPVLQVMRGLVLIIEVCVVILSFIKLGLIASHSIFICHPLIVTLLSGPLLGERVGWRRWAAVLVGFAGVLIILKPGGGVLSPWAVLPFAGALLFASYSLLTRHVSRSDEPMVNFFWIGVVGAVAITPFGLFYWAPMGAMDWTMMMTLCVSAAFGHWLLIRAYDVAEASVVQPFAYFQLPFVSLIGFVVFHDDLPLNVLIGAVIVVLAGLFTFWRQRQREGEEQIVTTGRVPPP